MGKGDHPSTAVSTADHPDCQRGRICRPPWFVSKLPADAHSVAQHRVAVMCQPRGARIALFGETEGYKVAHVGLRLSGRDKQTCWPGGQHLGVNTQTSSAASQMCIGLRQLSQHERALTAWPTDYGTERPVGSQSMASRIHFSYNGNSNHRGDPSTDGPHDRLRLEDGLLVSRFKSLPRHVCFTLPRIGILCVSLCSPCPNLPFLAGRIPAGRSTW